MKYTIKAKGSFKKAYKRCIKRGLDPEVMRKALEILSETGSLPPEYLPHRLHGDYQGCMECHLQPDWLLVWEQYDSELVLVMVTTGSHSDIFNKKRR